MNKRNRSSGKISTDSGVRAAAEIKIDPRAVVNGNTRISTIKDALTQLKINVQILRQGLSRTYAGT